MRILGVLLLAGFGFFAAGAGALVAEENNHGRTPVGMWEPPNGENRWEITACGEPGAICAQLVWIREDRLNKRNKNYIGRYLFQELPLRGAYKWRGPVTLEGVTVTGTVTQPKDNVIVVRACLLVFCEETKILRVAESEIEPAPES